MSKSKEQLPSFFIICFTTDIDAYRPMTIIRQYVICEECSNVKYIKEEGVEYDHHFNKDLKFRHFKFIEILNIDKLNSKCIFADSYLLFINLEKEDIFEQMDLIYNYIQNNGNTDRKIYVLGLYMNKSNIKDEYKEEKIREYLEQQKLNCEYSELNFDSTNDLVKTIDFISCDTIKNKKNIEQIKNKKNNDLENGQSNSKCIIF